MRYIIFLILFLAIGCKRMPNYIVSKENPQIVKTRKAELLTAFFGLDNAMPIRAKRIWSEAPGKDGMPLVFSHELDPTTLNAEDFQITTQKGKNCQ